MARGITITNYLATGDPEGVIFAYMSNWSGQAIKIPRNLFAEAREFPELDRPGLYFLLGQDENNPDDKLVYVGEANILAERVVQHLRDSDKSFAETIVCFCSKDENLTVSHTKYLEQKTILQLNQSSEYRLMNKKDGSIIKLPIMVQDEMDTYFDNMKIILPTLGFPILHTDRKVKLSGAESQTDLLYLEVAGYKATARLTSNGIEVQKNSEMKVDEVPSLSPGYSNLRKTLIDKSVVIHHNGKYAFANTYEFPSPSSAAAVIMGYPANGRTLWKTRSGKSLKQLEEEQIGDI